MLLDQVREAVRDSGDTGFRGHHTYFPPIPGTPDSGTPRNPPRTRRYGVLAPRNSGKSEKMN